MTILTYSESLLVEIVLENVYLTCVVINLPHFLVSYTEENEGKKASYS